MGFKHLDIRRNGPIERLVLNRPEVRNAFNEGMIAELTWWANSVSCDGSVRLVVLEGAGPTFCAGADLEWMGRMAEFSHDQNVDDATEMARMFQAMDRLPVPVIGRIHGAALGGGAGLVAICDIVVAAENTIFGFTEVRLGLIPAIIAPFVLAKIGRSATRELFLTAERFDAGRAHTLGLVHKIVPESGLDAAVAGYVHELMQAAPGALCAAKQLLAEIGRRGPSDVASLCVEAIATRRVSAEGQEGMKAFLEKRKPAWVAEGRMVERSKGRTVAVEGSTSQRVEE
jgi:methylglutaconyl-CoA hydratase